jgi:hypothetical protein
MPAVPDPCDELDDAAPRFLPVVRAARLADEVEVHRFKRIR